MFVFGVHEAQLGLRLYMEMYAVKRVASIHFSHLFVLFCLVMNDKNVFMMV